MPRAMLRAAALRVITALGLAAALTCVGPGCDRSPDEPPAKRKEPAAASETADNANNGDPAGESRSTPSLTNIALPPRLSVPERLVAIGDVHGDLQAARAALRLAGAIDDKDRWSGGKLVVVQTGDQLDRGDGERAILDWFERLEAEARKAGGAFVVLNGNHEVMNVQGDFRYVTPGAMSQFDGAAPAAPGAKSVHGASKGRAEAFLPGGEYARLLAERDIVAIVGDSVFAHGGVLPGHLRYGIERMNRELSEWMLGKRSAPPAIAVGQDAPIWTRAYGSPAVPRATCEELQAVLDALDAQRLVVGHTVQRTGISSGCEERVWRIDVGLSRHYGDNPVQVLEVRGGKTRVLTAP